MVYQFGFFFLALLGWLMPNHYSPWTSFYNDFAAWFGLLVLALGIALRPPEGGVKIPPVAAAILCVAMIPPFQYYAGLIFFAGDALVASLYVAGLALAIVLGKCVADKHKFADLLAWLILIGSIVSVFLAFNQWLGLDSLGIWLFNLPPDGRPYANLAQPNNLASLLFMGVVSALYLRERNLFSTSVLALIVLVLFAGISMTRSRTAVVVMLVIAGWLVFSIKRLQIRLGRIEVFVGGSVFLALWVAWPLISELLFLTSQSRLEGVAGEVRWTIWQQLLVAAIREPWSGYGWNQTVVAQMSVAAEYPKSVFTEHAHNFIVDLLCWNGLLIGGVLSASVIWWLFSRLRYLSGLSAWFGMSVVLILLTHSMFEYPLDYGYFLVPFGLAIGLIEADFNKPVIALPKSVFKGVVLFGCVMSIWIFVEYMAVQTDYYKMRFESAGYELRTSDHMAPDVVLLTQSREFIRFARTEAKEGMSASELEWMRQVAFRFAYPPVMFRYALALALNEQYDAASMQLMRLRQLHPDIRFKEALDAWQEMGISHPNLKKVRLPEDLRQAAF